MMLSIQPQSRVFMALAFISFLVLISPDATAAAADSDGSTASQGTALEEVVVTARRREEDAQKVPIALTVVSPAVLKANNITTVEDLSQLVPSMSVTTGNVGQRDSANVAIR